MRHIHVRTKLAGLFLLSLTGCTVGPDYHRPSAPVPAGFKEAQGWREAKPSDAKNRGPWWSIYNDPVLDMLEQQVNISNQNVKSAEAAYRAAQATVSEGRAAWFPTVTVAPSATYSQTTPLSGTSTVASQGGRLQIEGTVGWDLDVWGRIRRTVESNVANAQVSAADIAVAQLSAQATLASDYENLRAADQLKRLLDSTSEAYAKSLKVVQNQYAAGVTAKSDVATAETQLQQTQAQAVDVGVRRAQFEHAIAILIGKPPAELTITPAPFSYVVPDIPVGLPSSLLERRPDIAGAERQMAAANALIGVAIAAYYPDISLSAAIGAGGVPGGAFFSASEYLWSVGANVAETVFDAGLRHAQVSGARATYDEAVANYRQTVLTSFQQVEDQLAALRILEQESAVQDLAVKSAQEAEKLTLNEYQAGTIAYTSVVVAQAAALSDEQAALTIWQNRLVASVGLIEALGGGWNASQLPNRATIMQTAPSWAVVP